MALVEYVALGPLRPIELSEVLLAGSFLPPLSQILHHMEIRELFPNIENMGFLVIQKLFSSARCGATAATCILPVMKRLVHKGNICTDK
jgi:hypothetical protein